MAFFLTFVRCSCQFCSFDVYSVSLSTPNTHLWELDRIQISSISHVYQEAVLSIGTGSEYLHCRIDTLLRCSSNRQYNSPRFLISQFIFISLLICKNWLIYCRYKWQYYTLQNKWQKFINSDNNQDQTNFYLKNNHKYGRLSYVARICITISVIVIICYFLCGVLITLGYNIVMSYGGVLAFLFVVAVYGIIVCKTPKYNEIYFIHWDLFHCRIYEDSSKFIQDSIYHCHTFPLFKCYQVMPASHVVFIQMSSIKVSIYIFNYPHHH